MSAVIVVALCALLGGAVDPTSARATNTRNLRLLDEGEAALQEGAAALAFQKALAVDESERRLDRPRFLLLRGRSRIQLGLDAEGAADLAAARPGVAVAQRLDLDVELATVWRRLGRFDACADILLDHPLPSLADRGAVLAATCLRGTSRAALAHEVLGGRSGDEAVLLRARVRLEDHLPRLARDDVAGLIKNRDLLDDDAVRGLARDFDAAGDHRFADVLRNLIAVRSPETTAGGRARRRSAEEGPTLRHRDLPLIDEGQRLRARLTLLVDDQAWDQVVALLPRLRAAHWLDDDDVRYAAAWALFATGDLDGAAAVLDGITGAAAFARATEMRAALLACRQTEERCPR